MNLNSSIHKFLQDIKFRVDIPDQPFVYIQMFPLQVGHIRVLDVRQGLFLEGGRNVFGFDLFDGQLDLLVVFSVEGGGVALD